MEDKNRELGFLTETLKTIKDNTAVYTSVIELIRSVQESINKLPQVSDSKSSEILIHDIQKKVEAVHSYMLTLGNTPQQNTVALNTLLTNLQNVISEMHVINKTLDESIERLTEVDQFHNKTDVKINELLKESKTIISNLGFFISWSKIKLPFIIGMITFILWIASVISVSNSFNGWMNKRFDTEVAPLVDRLEQLEKTLVDQFAIDNAKEKKP